MKDAAGPQVDQANLQGNVLCGYGNKFRHALYAFVDVDDGEAGRRWLAELAERVTNAVPWRSGPPRDTLNVALSFDGLAAVGVPAGILETFPDDFRQGMPARADMLGDSGPNAPDRWDEGLRPREEGERPAQPHLLVSIAARDADALERRRAELLARIEGRGSGLSLAHLLPAELLDYPGEGQFGREHFGFADGLAQPSIADDNAGPWDWDGRGAPLKEGGWEPLAPGEFVLGYPDAEGVVAEAPAEPLRHNGSYMVARKLHQDVATFTNCLRRTARDDPNEEELLAAKIIGRWRDGRPLVLCPEPAATGLAPQELNDFRYDADPDGLSCPLGAHIRRSNPRDALGFEEGRTRRHRIIRRGMPYGPRPADPAVPDGKERGLMFICYQASIARQFETIQAEWLNDGDALGLGGEKDFLLAGEEREGRMTIQGRPPRFLSPTPQFVTLRGGGYFFAPGIAALRELGAGIRPAG